MTVAHIADTFIDVGMTVLSPSRLKDLAKSCAAALKMQYARLFNIAQTTTMAHTNGALARPAGRSAHQPASSPPTTHESASGFVFP
eukprot:CAMPEP_0176164060 /NCGR_PEP_ID=MMETSP0120_2-20121206/83929_1 /TAXON_ID=160619 /ORGANISM="Kryptoperidinium foliaceum, Strain CCMP 1326" /LENGTH=85 /DNA_ID=CAMNT_0017501591 /DNA_START=1199 /DNA_END=1452 /DNA_ORIENTATION=-